MHSPTYGKVDYNQMADIMKSYIYNHGVEHQYELSIGTDSQNFHDTKMVVVVALCDIGHGGIYFFDVEHMRKILNVREKLTIETTKSLECAQKVLEAIEDNYFGQALKNVHISIHVDAGPNGKSADVIPEICGWVRSCGYDVQTKPESYAASGIANRISK